MEEWLWVKHCLFAFTVSLPTKLETESCVMLGLIQGNSSFLERTQRYKLILLLVSMWVDLPLLIYHLFPQSWNEGPQDKIEFFHIAIVYTFGKH